MELIAHRGFWKTSNEKNTLNAFERAFNNQFGVETDIRDYKGRLVISHNIAEDSSPLVKEMFKLYADTKCSSALALNIKADGLQVLLKPLLEKFSITNYFLFDMSIPELVVNEREKLTYYTRHSDIEHKPVMLEKSAGVWLDSFYDDQWLSPHILEGHIKSNKKICIVSPELHGYAYEQTWAMIKKNGYHHSGLIALCTDIPDIAKEYFNEQN